MDLETPSPFSPAAELTTLPNKINKATRKQHTELNKLILDRLPLGLPPHTRNPELLGKGLTPFAHIYFTFEAAWDSLTFSNLPKDSHDAHLIRALLALRPQGLARSQRLKDDLNHISKCTGVDLVETDSNISHLDALNVLMNETVVGKPHGLVAYAWVMYMAIFSGGRYIRAEMREAGLNFWTGEHERFRDVEASDFEPGGSKKSEAEGLRHEHHATVPLDMPGFSFLSFDGPHDGEDIKTEFKARLHDLEKLLTPEERQHIVEAARKLFDHCISVIKAIKLPRKYSRADLLKLFACWICYAVWSLWVECNFSQDLLCWIAPRFACDSADPNQRTNGDGFDVGNVFIVFIAVIFTMFLATRIDEWPPPLEKEAGVLTLVFLRPLIFLKSRGMTKMTAMMLFAWLLLSFLWHILRAALVESG